MGEPAQPRRTLSAQLEVSRPTLRPVVDDLVRDGALIRRHGSGVFVAREKIAQSLVQFDGASNAVSSVDGHWTSRVVGFGYAWLTAIRCASRRSICRERSYLISRPTGYTAAAPTSTMLCCCVNGVT